MSNNEILLKILEELKMNETSFQESIIRGQMIHYGIILTTLIVGLIVFVNIAKKINDEYYVKENIEKTFEKMKLVITQKPNNNYDNVVEASKEERPLMDDIENIKNYFKNSTIGARMWSIVIGCVELYALLKLIILIVSNAIVFISCFVAPEKVIMDYLSTLF